MGSSVLGIETSEQPQGRRRTKMGRQVVDLEIQREGNKPWGLRIVGGADVATVMKVEKVLGIDTPAYKAGDESKLDPEGPAYQKMKNSKKFDPKRSSVLMVLNAQMNGDFAVDTGEVREAREQMWGEEENRRI